MCRIPVLVNATAQPTHPYFEACFRVTASGLANARSPSTIAASNALSFLTSRSDLRFEGQLSKPRLTVCRCLMGFMNLRMCSHVSRAEIRMCTRTHSPNTNLSLNIIKLGPPVYAAPSLHPVNHTLIHALLFVLRVFLSLLIPT